MLDNLDEKNIREELSKTLTEVQTNYSKILEYSPKLASFDNDNIRFTVDAGVIDRLGNELVARQETAVSELVKNSYSEIYQRKRAGQKGIGRFAV